MKELNNENCKSVHSGQARHWQIPIFILTSWELMVDNTMSLPTALTMLSPTLSSFGYSRLLQEVRKYILLTEQQALSVWYD